MRFLTTVSFVMILFFGGARIADASSQVGGDSRFTNEEYLALPRPCLAQRFIHDKVWPPQVSESERRGFENALGQSYVHYHHYCWGLIYLRRAAGNPEKSRSNYNAAIQNFDYVIRNSTPDFPMLPEVFLRTGMTLRFLGEHARAATEYLKAVRAKPDYTPAYSALIDLHLDLGDTESAQRVLETGLRQAPNSKILEQKQTELDALTSKR